MASGINNTFRQVGIATGIAVLGAIFESSLTTTITPKLAGTPAAGQGAEIARAVAAGGAQKVVAGIPAAERAAASTAIHAAYASSMNDILLVAAIVAFIGAVLGLVLVRGSDFVTYGPPQPKPQPEPARTAVG